MFIAHSDGPKLDKDNCNNFTLYTPECTHTHKHGTRMHTRTHSHTHTHAYMCACTQAPCAQIHHIYIPMRPHSVYTCTCARAAYVCMCACTRMGSQNIRALSHKSASLHTCLHTCPCLCPHTCLPTCPYTCLPTCPYISLHTCPYICAHTNQPAKPS